jgi:hypothetical protein
MREYRIHPMVNESIHAVMNSLKPASNEDMLAICASGDMPIALVEHARTVIALDRCNRQVEYARERVKQIRRGDYAEFRKVSSLAYLEQSFLGERTEYFTDERLDRIRAKLNNLVIMHDDIECYTGVQKPLFAKSYLANVFDFIENTKAAPILKAVADRTPVGGLVYHSTGVTLKNVRVPAPLQLCEERTRLARESTQRFWDPLVYKKVDC